MDTKIEMKVVIAFKLSDLAARVALETKIENYIGAQAEGSYSVNEVREDPKNLSNPFWFRTALYIVAVDIAVVSSARTAILAALDAMPECVQFTLNMRETGTIPRPE